MKIHTAISNLKKYRICLKVQRAVEEFLLRKGYLKIDLPVLSPALIPESYLEVFETEFRYLDKREKLYFTPSPELFLKRLLVEGIGSCYYLGKSFRNSEPNSRFHSREFTMLEYYKVGVWYLDLAEEILEMLQTIAKKISKRDEIIYQGKRISFKKWEKFSVTEAFEKFSQISEKELFDNKKFMKRADQKGYKTKG
ncbi:hypothetical protein HYW87_00025, partial [Candidatus Roizmanbacteria bacterium]|nr:hypothetical protein [Candidatus Roizmanbacteria bacterium]